MKPYNTSAIHDAKDFMIEPSDLSCIENTQVLTQFLGDYQKRAFYEVLHRLMACLTSATNQDNERIFLMPREIYSLVQEEKPIIDLHPLEKILATIFIEVPSMHMLFVDNNEFRPNSFFSASNKHIKFGKPNSFMHDMTVIERIPTNPKELISDIKILLTSKTHLLEDIGVSLVELLMDDDFNPEYKKQTWESFSVMFKDKDEFEFHQEWFYKIARSGDVSSYGDFDMAYHGYVNGSDIIPALIQRYKELM